MAGEAKIERLESRLVWIMGSPRSGSTWLLRLICHPWELDRTPSGIDTSKLRLNRRGPDVVPINESYLFHHLAPLQEARAEGGGPLLLNDLRRADPAYAFSGAFEGQWRPALRRLTLERFAAHAEAARRQHGIDDPIVVIKEPNGSHAAEAMARLLPRSRLIFLLRDGRDVVDSMIAADSPGGWRTRTEGVAPLEREEQRLAAVEREARLWLLRTIAVERAAGLLGPERTITVRYEDLLDDTEGELARLDRWLGLDRSPAEIRAAARGQRFGSLRNRLRGSRKGVRAASPGLWRENLAEAERNALERLLGDKLAELGY